MEEIKLICFDLDKTLIKQNSWYKLGLALGVSHEEDQRLLHRYEAGEITYDEWNAILLEKYIEHADATREGITTILSRYEYADGAWEAVTYLRNKGYKLTLICIPGWRDGAF